MMWKKCKKLGEGTYGTVHLAVADDSDSPFMAAVKTAELEECESLQREAQFLKALRGNPYIIQGYGEDISLEENGEYFYNLLMECASGGTLNHVIDSYEGIMPESHVAGYTYMLLKGLSCIHNKGIIHCDLKPENVLAFPSQTGPHLLKIADFGLSKHVWETEQFWGTEYFAAPESLIRGVEETTADIWSLGCTVLLMMNGGKHIWKDEKQLEADIPEYLSQSGKDFLKHCFQDVNSRWSADMLLDHPFIKENIKGKVLPSRPESSISAHQTPFGSEWITNEGMFSARVLITRRKGRIPMNSRWSVPEFSRSFSAHQTPFSSPFSSQWITKERRFSAPILARTTEGMFLPQTSAKTEQYSTKCYHLFPENQGPRLFDF